MYLYSMNMYQLYTPAYTRVCCFAVPVPCASIGSSSLVVPAPTKTKQMHA